MKRTIICALSVAGLLTGCAHQNGVSNGEARAEARAEHRAEARAERADANRDPDGVEMPRHRTNHDRIASTGDSLPVGDPSNTEVNTRDRSGDTLTPMDQGNSELDLDLTQRIRKAVMADDSLSFTAKNAKIISRDGRVTLRGTVPTAAEKTSIGKAATDVAGAGHVTNQLDVSAP